MTSPAASAPAQGYLAEQPALRWNGARPLLTVFDIELTERCNNNCIHCCINLPERDRSARKRELSTEAVEELLRQGAELGALTVRFSGGEPLLRDDFTELYLYARRLGLRVMLFTNARLITPELAGLFARIPPREPVEITVYGMSADSCAAVTRSRGAFAEFRRGVDLLIRHRIPFFLKGTMLPETRSELEQLLSWSQSIPGMKELPSFVLFLELRHRRDSEARNRQIEKLRLSPREAIEVLARDPDVYKADLHRLCRYVAGKPTDLLFTCNAGNQICIDAYGQIQYCLALRHPGTVVNSSIYPLEFALREFFPQLRQMRATNPDFINRCARCMHAARPMRTVPGQVVDRTWRSRSTSGILLRGGARTGALSGRTDRG